MNKSTLYIVSGVVVLAVIGGFLYFQRQNQGQPLAGEEQTQQNQEQESPGLVATAVVLYTDDGFAPQTFNIKQGETVTFVNGSENPMWPASAVHPTHQVYPGSDIKKCDTAEKTSIFDACKPIEPNQEWSFTFLQKGSWGYHDHLNPGRRGVIVVE